MKIIHIVENLDKGAVENWLVNIFVESRKIRPSWDWTFYCILGREGRLDEKVRNAGGKIVYSPVTVSDKIGFLKSLRRVLKAGKFDIIHAHHDYLSGFYLLASAESNLKDGFYTFIIPIKHCQSATEPSTICCCDRSECLEHT